MKLYHYLFIIILVIFIGCQNKPVQKMEQASSTIPTKQTCYSYIKDKDTASLMYISSGPIITGELKYKLFEKDSNTGIIKGQMKGDTLIAEYTFGSEGSQSIRQVAFLKKDGKLIEGFGEVIEKDGKMIFKDLSNLKFTNAIEFTKVACK